MDAEGGGMEIVWRNITVEQASLPAAGPIIKRVQGKIEPSTMAALVGVSGAGKTALLNAIVGKSKEGLKVSGEVLLNGHSVDVSTWEHAVGFVGEHLHAYETQTVEETLRFSMMASRGLRPGAAVNSEVSELLQTLGLSRIAGMPVSTTSTGERVRLSLGIVLVKRPSVLIMDEVTNELDSFNIIHMLKVLMGLKTQGKGIMVSFQRLPQEMLPFFDRVTVIFQGEVVFSGRVDECIRFLGSCGYDLAKHVSPSDFFVEALSMDVSTPEAERESLDRMEQLRRSWKEIEPPAVSSIIRRTEVPVVLDTSILDFVLVFKRNLLDFFRRAELVKVVAIQKLMTMTLLIFVYCRLDYTQMGIRDRFGIMSFITINSFEKTAAVTIIFLDSHRKALKREICAGMYGAVTAYFSSLLSSFCVSGMSNVVYTSVVYWIVGLNPSFLRFVFFAFVLTTIMLFSISFSVVLVMSTKTLIQAQVLAATAMMSFVMFGGTFVTPDTIPAFARWAIWVSPVYYAFEAIVQSQLENLSFECTGSDETCISNGREALHAYGFRRISYGVSTGIFLLITVASVVLGAISVKRVTKPRVAAQRA